MLRDVGFLSLCVCLWSSTVSDAFKGKFLESWSLLSTIRKPIIAAVSGYAVSHSFHSLLWQNG